jgi:hypothetical protein
MKKNDAEEIKAFMSELDHPMKPEVEALRDIILAAGGADLGERIKWKVPSYYLLSDPKKDMLAFHLRGKGFIQLVFVFYDGKIIESASLLEGDYTDRRLAKFTDMNDILAKKPELEKVINDLLELYRN